MPILATKIGGEGVIVRRDEVKRYVEDPVFLEALEIWHYTKLWGLPNGKGWANEPEEVLRSITAIELEQRAIESEEVEKSRDNRGSQNKVRRGR